MANISSAQLNRPTTPLQANSNIITNNGTTNQSGGSSNSIRLLAGSHNGQQVAGTSVAASAVNSLSSQGSSSTSSASSTTSNPSNLAFFQANPHLLNAAALHSTLFAPAANVNNTNSVVFKEPLNVQHSADSISSKKSNNRLIFESATHTKDIFLQPESTKLDSLTPCSTPNQKRKDTNRRRSNLFTVILINKTLKSYIYLIIISIL